MRFVLQLLSETAGLGVCPLRIFLTSRPEIPIRLGIADIPEAQRRHLILYRIERAVVDNDLFVFFSHRLHGVRRQHALHCEWPAGADLQRLVDRAGGLFISAATACRYICGGGPNANWRLFNFLDGEASTSEPERSLDQISLLVVRDSIANEATGDEIREQCDNLKKVVGTIAILSLSLSVRAIASLLQLQEHEVVSVLFPLFSIIDVPDSPGQPVRLHHASVRDFILSDTRCDDARFWVDEKRAHAQLAQKCLKHMGRHLTRDMCSLGEPDIATSDVDQALIDANISSQLLSTGFGLMGEGKK